MAWKMLPTDYTDASWSGLKRYNTLTNEDGTVSFQDVTAYSNKDKSFFGAKDANRMNEALNTIMSMVENGTDLYTAFQIYFDEQKGLFEDYMDVQKAEADEVVETIKTDYRAEIDTFEENQEAIFSAWFGSMKNQLSQDAAGNLQNQVDELDTKTDGFVSRETTISEDGKTITEVYGNKKITTHFSSGNRIIQRFYENNVNVLSKITTISSDGLTIKEEVR